MKRLIASVIVVVAFTFYAIFSRGSTATTLASSTNTATGSSPETATAQPVRTSGEDDDEAAVVQQTANTQVTSAASSGYADGTYTGAQANALYGVVQVQVTVQGGQITDVQFLSHPTGHRSDEINARAVPLLTQEAVAAQSANVQVVSGATLTSKAFMESLQSALSQA
jgi:uncharacterized protein with FMN-binding domain